MPCITLISDLGTDSTSVAAAKGILMQYAPQLLLVDISHSIAAQNLPEAAYVLNASYKHFPNESFHIVLTDVYSEKNTSLVLCKKDGHYFLAADNSILSLALRPGVEKTKLIYRSEITDRMQDWLHQAGKTIQSLLDNNNAAANFPDHELKPCPEHWLPKISNDKIECHVIHIDRFGNVVLNITVEEFEAIRRGRPFIMNFARGESVSGITQQYSGVKDGGNICRVNGGGYLEIAINKGNASRLFGLQMSVDKHTIYSTFHIYFG